MINSRNALEVIDRGQATRLDIEKIAIGSAICFDDCWSKARAVVADVVFSDAKNKFFWSILKSMKNENRDIDVSSLLLYVTNKYPQIKNIGELASYICELTMTVVYDGYDKVLSELLRYYSLEKRYDKQ